MQYSVITIQRDHPVQYSLSTTQCKSGSTPYGWGDGVNMNHVEKKCIKIPIFITKDKFLGYITFIVRAIPRMLHAKEMLIFTAIFNQRKV